ncbi:hypothetical protein IWW41_000659 [Coemansia sp. RSA 2522]|nr:hypothetical protein IWW41_000659 [Coemansia sp. RSA 2522]
MSVSQIRQVLINSASPLSDPTSRLKINPYRSGAGLVNVYNALRTRVLIDPPYLSINQTAWTQPSDSTDATTQGVRISTHMLNFTNTDLKKGVNVILTHDAASSLTVYDKDGSYSQSILDNYIVPTWPNDTTPVPQNTIPQAIMSNEAQYVAAGQTMQFNVSIILPFGLAESERWYFGGFFNFTIMFDHEDYTMQHVVPYAGYNGDFSKINVLSPLSMGLPAFMDSEGNFIEDISTAKFDSENSTYLAFGLDVPTSFMYSVFIDSKNETVGYAADGNGVYLPRTLPTYDPYFRFTVNKTILAGDDFSQSAILPDGKYRLRIAVLRPFGDAGNDDDFEMWDSEEITFGE